MCCFWMLFWIVLYLPVATTGLIISLHGAEKHSLFYIALFTLLRNMQMSEFFYMEDT